MIFCPFNRDVSLKLYTLREGKFFQHSTLKMPLDVLNTTHLLLVPKKLPQTWKTGFKYFKPIS